MPDFVERESPGGSFIDPDKAPQFFEQYETQERRIVRRGWELPGSAKLYQSHGSLPDSFSTQAHIMYGRLAWFQPDKKRINPAARYEDPECKQVQLARKLIFPSKTRPEWIASLFCRISV